MIACTVAQAAEGPGADTDRRDRRPQLEGQVEVDVGDRGIGFSAADESNAFTPFYRSKEAEAVAAGVGIGLVVCQRIVESLGGSMRIGRREGGGAIVSFSLPPISLGEEEDLTA